MLSSPGVYKLPNFHQAEWMTVQNEMFTANKVTMPCKCDSQTAVVFHYRTMSPQAFHNLKAYDMRGLTFTKGPRKLLDSDMSGYNQRWLGMRKFFNVNETEGWRVQDLKAEGIIFAGAYPKQDGSLITFVQCSQCQEWLPKTHQSFSNEQAQLAKQLYDTMNQDNQFRNLLDAALALDKQLFFELVGPSNRVVVRYPKDELRLIAVRSTKTGSVSMYDWHVWESYLDIGGSVNKRDDKIVTLEDALLAAKDAHGIEGWVLEFIHPKHSTLHAKLKTDEYMRLHRMRTGNDFSYKVLLQMALDAKLDDAVAQMEPCDPWRTDVWRYSDALYAAIQADEDAVMSRVYAYHIHFAPNMADFARDSSAGALAIAPQLRGILFSTIRHELDGGNYVDDSARRFVRENLIDLYKKLYSKEQAAKKLLQELDSHYNK